VKTSSNGGAKEDFVAGPKVLFIVDDSSTIADMTTKVEGANAKIMTAAERSTIAGLGNSSSLDVGTTAATVAAGDDSRFGSVEYDELAAADLLDGTEIAALDQGGTGVQSTVQEIAGDPLIAKKGHAKNLIRGYCDFSNTRSAMNITTDATLCDLEPWQTLTNAATGTICLQFTAVGVQCFLISTGITTTGRMAIVHTQWRNEFNASRSMQTVFDAALTALPSVEAYTIQMGFMTGLPALATHGMYFQASAASANWRAVVRNAGVETSSNIDTGVALQVGVIPIFRIHYDPVALATKFYIDGALVATVLNSTRVITLATSLQMAYSIIKSAGTTSVGITNITNHKYEIETAPLTGFDL
jgi:hypothetical protein